MRSLAPAQQLKQLEDISSDGLGRSRCLGCCGTFTAGPFRTCAWAFPASSSFRCAEGRRGPPRLPLTFKAAISLAHWAAPRLARSRCAAVGWRDSSCTKYGDDSSSQSATAGWPGLQPPEYGVRRRRRPERLDRAGCSTCRSLSNGSISSGTVSNRCPEPSRAPVLPA